MPTLRYRGRVLLILTGLLALTAARATAAAVPGTRPVDMAGVAIVERLPLPAADLSAAAWTPGTAPDQLIDDFESPSWPDPATWPAVMDLSGASGSEVTWGPRDCRAAGGQRSLWAIGGGSRGASIPCGTVFADGQASSALLALDLRAMHGVSQLWLAFDIWADAAPSEGLFINVLEADALGNAYRRHIVYSATGRSSAWARGVKLDLVHLADRLGAWTMDARGQSIVLELLFVGLSGMPDGEGIFVDNLSLSSREATPIVVTATPGPDNTMGCTGGSGCGSLSVRAYVDSNCDGRFQQGIDTVIRSRPRVDVTAGAVVLGTSLSASGSAFFRLPYANGAVVTLAVPDGYVMCHNSPDPATLEAHDFKPFGRAKLDVRLLRAH